MSLKIRIATICILSSLCCGLTLASEQLPASSRSVKEEDEDSIGNRPGNSLTNERDRVIFPEKRAYTYVSEYKRLPVFKFGIGKRWNPAAIDNKRTKPYSFGIGKRTKGYQFGIGKRLSNFDDDYGYLPPNANYYNGLQPQSIFQDKRASGAYSFGIGKRAVEIDEEQARDGNSLQGERYLFNIANRLYDDEDEDNNSMV